MTKKELKRKLRKGYSVDEVFNHEVPGQDCYIFKAPWPKTVRKNMSQVVYIPDTWLNELNVCGKHLSSGEIHHILCNCYTVGDFMREGYNNKAVAKDLYYFVDWQHPNIQDLMDCTDDEEAMEEYGETWSQMERRVWGK